MNNWNGITRIVGPRFPCLHGRDREGQVIPLAISDPLSDVLVREAVHAEEGRIIHSPGIGRWADIATT